MGNWVRDFMVVLYYAADHGSLCFGNFLQILGRKSLCICCEIVWTMVMSDKFVEIDTIVALE